MIVVDTNALVSAHRRVSAFHYLSSADRDFSRFRELVVRNPL